MKPKQVNVFVGLSRPNDLRVWMLGLKIYDAGDFIRVSRWPQEGDLFNEDDDLFGSFATNASIDFKSLRTGPIDSMMNYSALDETEHSRHLTVEAVRSGREITATSRVIEKN